ncbi:MAG: phytochelatin synthase family protein, partial [Thermodesulfobacteriota bacterium]
MNKIIRSFVWSSLYLKYGFLKMTKTGPFGIKKPFYIRSAETQQDNLLKKKLIQNQEKQFNEAACSVASVVSVVNATGSYFFGDSFDKVTQQEILDKVRTGFWKERMSPGGHNGRRGLTLDLLCEVLKESFDIYKIPYESVEAVYAVNNKSKSEVNKLKKRLEEFEGSEKALIVAHFNQGKFIPSLEIPHISPVGGYNPETDRVLILDVDYTVKNNYTIDFDQFFKGMSDKYNIFFRRR